jgi:F-type H+-transporting ATPase subunit delta
VPGLDERSPVIHKRAAPRYAKAVFALAKERHQTELVGPELAELAAMFESDREVRGFFARSWIPAATRRMVAREIAQRSGLSKLTVDFLALVGGRRKVDHLGTIADAYRKLLDEDLGRVCARVRTAIPLTDDERRVLSAKLGKVLGARQVVLTEVVDPAMLGGVIAESGSVVLDGSLEGQLERMRRRLASG